MRNSYYKKKWLLMTIDQMTWVLPDRMGWLWPGYTIKSITAIVMTNIVYKLSHRHHKRKNLQSHMWRKQSDHCVISWKSCTIVTIWFAIRGVENRSKTKIKRANEAQICWSLARRKRRICTRCLKTLYWLLRENHSRTTKRSR